MTRARRGIGPGSVLLACLVLVLAACAGGSEEPEPASSELRLVAEIDQLRADQVLDRVQVGLVNSGDQAVVVESLHVRIPGFRSPKAVAKDSPVFPSVPVNLRWPYGEVTCGPDAAPEVGRPVVTLRAHTESDPTPRTVRLPATDPQGILQRIADRTCAVERVNRDVVLEFEDTWRAERGPDGVVLHGRLRARLRGDDPREITEVRGAILYGLRPDESTGAVPSPLARLTSRRREASIPVAAYAARCDGHTIGEIKKPYEFLVWVAASGEEPIAVTPAVGQPTKDALRLACSF
jgi:hypothetical protein